MDDKEEDCDERLTAFWRRFNVAPLFNPSELKTHLPNPPLQLPDTEDSSRHVHGELPSLHPPYEFRKENEHWIIAFGGTRFVLHHLKRLQYIHVLLGRPDEEVSATALGDTDGFRSACAAHPQSDVIEAKLNEGLNIGLPLEAITEEELRRLKNTINSIDVAIAQAQEFANHAEIERLQNDKDLILADIGNGPISSTDRERLVSNPIAIGKVFRRQFAEL